MLIELDRLRQQQGGTAPEPPQTMADFGSIVSGWEASSIDGAHGDSVIIWEDSYGSNDIVSNDPLLTQLQIVEGRKEVEINQSFFDAGQPADLNFIAGTDSFSIVVQVGSRLDLTSDGSPIFWGGGHISTRQYGITFSADRVYFYVGGVPNVVFGTIIQINDIVIATYNATTNLYELWVNNVLLTSVTLAPNIVNNTINNLNIGARGLLYDLYDGSMEGVWVYDEVLTVDKVNSIQNYLTNTPEPEPDPEPPVGVLAFPSAYGAGAYTTGGRGGTVSVVTNLNDSGPGSLREALGMEVPRTIVFDVSGVITLESILYVGVHNSNVTIAGQTAPEGGITIVGHRVYIEDVDNLICRYIRFRGGITAEGFGYEKNDSLTVTGNITNQIFDHCSFSYDGDETADWSTITNGKIIDKITVQRSIFGEGEKGVLFGGQSDVMTGEMSLHHSLFYNITHRTPNVAGYNGAKIETINNVVWTTSNRLVRTDGNPTWNHINNYYDYGNTPISDGRLNMQTAIDSDPPKIYTSGNKIVSQFSINPMTRSLLEINENNKLLHRYFLNQQGHLTGDILNADYFTDTQHPLLGRQINIQSADDAFNDVTTDVGCNARLNADGSVSDNKDVLDAEWLNNIAQGEYVARSSPSTWVVPAIPSRTRSTNFYISNPHIPEVWFQSNVPTGQDHNDIAPSGYTWIEEYINQVDN